MSVIYHYNNLKQKNTTLSDECVAFMAAALDTWYRIQFSRTRPRLKIHETTITQNLVYELTILKASYSGLKFRLFESVEEKTQGDDLELKIRMSQGQYITFAIQPKILYHASLPNGRNNLKKGNYPKLNHTVEDRSAGLIHNQVDLLLAYAKSKGYIPLYLLYNYIESGPSIPHFCGIPFNSMQFGCSVVAAEYLKSNFRNPSTGNLKSNVKFSDLHPSVALPWSIIPCCFANYSDSQIFSHLKTPLTQVFKEAEYIYDPQKWQPLNAVFGKRYEEYVREQESRQVIGFDPKFQIVID